MRNKSYAFKRFREDLQVLGFRHRRAHDLRRTMISLSREDGARKDILELCTHNPQKKGSSIDVYTTFPWEALCREVAKLVIHRRSPDNLVELRAAVAARPPQAATSRRTTARSIRARRRPSAARAALEKSRSCATACYTFCYTGRGFQRNPRPFVVEAPGVEPGSESAPFKSLRAYPAIWFSSRGLPTGGASSHLASEVSRPRPQAPARPLAR